MATIVISAAITWGATVATIRNDQSNVANNLATLSKQMDEVKAQISGVRSAQDGVLKLSGEVDALRQRVGSLESRWETQIQLNGILQRDIARLQSDINYLGRK